MSVMFAVAPVLGRRGRHERRPRASPLGRVRRPRQSPQPTQEWAPALLELLLTQIRVADQTVDRAKIRTGSVSMTPTSARTHSTSIGLTALTTAPASWAGPL